MMPAHSSGAASMSLDAVGQRVDEVLAGDHPLGVAPVDRPPGELRQLAEVLQPREALLAVAAGSPKPGEPDPFPAARDPADDLVAGDQRRLSERDVALEDLQVGAADATGATSITISPSPATGASTVCSSSLPGSVRTIACITSLILTGDPGG